MNIIKSFDSVNRLYRKGVNICKGCERENRPTYSGNQKSNNVQCLTRPTAQRKDDERNN